MKFLKKASLAAAIAAASISAQAGMVALDDETMAATTGQAGVTIELNLQAGTGANAAVKVGGIDYTDEGQIQINDVWVGSATGISIKQNIDVEADGRLKIVVDPVTGLQVGVGSVHLANQAGAVQGEALVSNVSLGIDLGTSTTLIGSRDSFAAAGTDVSMVAAAAGDAGVDGNTMVIDSSSSLKITSGSLEALGGGVKVGSLTFDDNGGNAVIKQKIFASDKGLNIVMESIQGDLRIGDITLGKASNASIGSVTVSDIVLAGVTQTIYGH